MSYNEMIEKLRQNPNLYSGYRDDLKGILVITRENGLFLFIDCLFNMYEASEILTVKDYDADDWKIAARTD